MADFYEAFRISGCWYQNAGPNEDDVMVRGVSLYAACQLYLFQLLAPELAGNTQSGRFVQCLKKNGLDWHLKLAASRFSVEPVPDRGGYPRFVALYDTHNSAMVDSVSAVALHLAENNHSVVPVSSDPQLAKRAKGSCAAVGYSRYYSYKDELECRQIWRRHVEHITVAVESLKRYCNQLSSNGIDLSSIHKYVMNFMKQTVRDIIALDNLYRELKPTAVFMGSDSHKLGRISALLGAKYPWRTLVLQHGAPMLPHAYVPVYADWIAVWSDSYKQWFLRHGVPDSKIVVTGSPRFDCYLAKPIPEQRPKLVWLTTPVNDDIVRFCFVRILPVMRALGLELVIKPHPSEPAALYRDLAAATCCPGCRVATGVKVSDVIAAGDLVFCLNSTAGIEAIALGGLLFVIDIPSVPNSIPYRQHRVAKVLTENSDVVAEVCDLMAYSTSPEYKREAEDFVASYLGLLDGNATRRVCDFIVRETCWSASHLGCDPSFG